MSSLVAKEIRLLLPAYVLALLLAITPIWLLSAPTNGNVQALAVVLPIFGALMLALSSFGREFGMGTFALLLTQPLPRRRIWWTKITVLACALASVGAAFFLSYPVWTIHEPLWYERSPQLAVNLGVTALVILAGGLWTTVLLRQMVAAFWFALLVPGAIVTIILWREGSALAVYFALGLYSVGGFWWAWRQFHQAQEVAWTGGDVSLPVWQSSDADGRRASRAQRPIVALLWKEFQLYQVALMGMAGLFLLHLGIIALRKALPATDERTLLTTALEMFGGVWFIVPLLTAGLSVAEERRLGTLEAQLCLPVSIRAQFVIKLLFALVLSGGLSALLLWTAEGIGGAIGAGAGVGAIKLLLGGAGLPTLSALFVAIALITFHASTLTRNFLQAMAAAVGTSIVLSIAWACTGTRYGEGPEIAGVTLWQRPIISLISLPAMAGAIVWLASGNFRRSSELRRLWSGNVIFFGATMLSIAVLAFALYNRAWEFVTPFEPGHGQAQLKASEPPIFHVGHYEASVVLPDGSLWQDHITYDPGKEIKFGDDNPLITFGGRWVHLTSNHFAPGSNWVCGATLHEERAAIRSDGTLWVSEMPTSPFRRSHDQSPPQLIAQPFARMIQFGRETDWSNIISGPFERSALLLKADGTLWLWGTNRFNRTPPALAGCEPRRIGAQSDWTDIITTGLGIFAWERDGRAWKLNYRTGSNQGLEIVVDPELSIERCPGLDNTKWRSLAEGLGVREDGTLWRFREPQFFLVPRTEKLKKQSVQIGTDADWLSAATGPGMLVALKRDGSLWKWELGARWYSEEWHIQNPPTRLGTHTDWVAIGEIWEGLVSLAGDGSLWYWSSRNDYTLLAPSRKPEKIENIFDRQ